MSGAPAVVSPNSTRARDAPSAKTGKSLSNVSSTGSARRGPDFAFSFGRNDATNGLSTIGATNSDPMAQGASAAIEPTRGNRNNSAAYPAKKYRLPTPPPLHV